MYEDVSFEEMRNECLQSIQDRNCKLIEEWCEEAGLTEPVGYHNELVKHVLTIYTNRPGYLIGRGGCLVDKFNKKLCEEFHAQGYDIKFVEIRGGFANLK